MKVNTFSFKNAESILRDTSAGLYDELMAILTALDIKLWDGRNITRELQPLFQGHDWEKAPYVLDKSHSRKRYDFGKGRVGVEVENSQSVRIYHNFLKFQLGYNAKRIDVGVLIVWGEAECRRTYRERQFTGTEPSDSFAERELVMMSEIFSVPILILGVESNSDANAH